ncbi:AraC family transcriptional regulator [Niastella yeongjuensis]|uniref:AraC family transcriptional regulator n=1 Tax=Niastella yeongjuensis TaxID=354355 RepID=A0A1V9EGF9_9BACT|nr:helix-turn-helix transcriptional regulator [Niastella yeongjuensis]OQP45005.1 AraC family transcriptional regulator [Niastella yeongjuensis]SEP49108.1 AraC-type DNA-binding protein [Niastella yeongjuensis]
MLKYTAPHIIQSISEIHRVLGLPKPRHPLVSFFRFEQMGLRDEETLNYYSAPYYSIAIKKNFKGKMRYGQSFYDFDEGMMSFIGPGQLLGSAVGVIPANEGFCLLFHPDFLKGYPLAATLKDYGFFSYDLNEALHLSEEEEKLVEGIMLQIEREYEATIDTLSQDVMITHITLLLQYCQRFYNRQFITRKPANNDLLARFDQILEEYFESGSAISTGLPSVQYLAGKLNVSPGYLGDLLRAITGQSTQGHIQNKVIEKTKILLATTNLSIAEVAYTLGFERPQSLSKLFRNKTNQSPTEYRSKMN